MTFFRQFWRPVFSMLFGPPFSAFWGPKGAKRVPIGGNFRSLWGYRWKCENNGFVFTKLSFSWFEGIPSDIRSLQKSVSKKQLNKNTEKTQKITKFASQRDPQGRPKGCQRTNIFVTFSTWPLQGCPGKPQGRQKTPTDTKIPPK